MSHLLEGKRLTKRYAGLTAVDRVDFQLEEGQILGLIGPNGAGKTTLINLVSGTQPPTEGEVRFRGRSLVGLKPHRIGQLGICRTFQIVKPFRGLSVLDNVRVGALFGKAGRPHGVRQAQRAAEEILRFVGLHDRRDTHADELNVPQLKRLELAKALAMDPVVLLLDEVMAGLNPTEVDETVQLIRKIRDERGVTVLVIEHVMRAIVGVCDRVFVLHHGQKIAAGPPQEVLKDRAVIQAYLGKRYAELAGNP